VVDVVFPSTAKSLGEEISGERWASFLPLAFAVHLKREERGEL
jgi:hypothetical protein